MNRIENSHSITKTTPVTINISTGHHKESGRWSAYLPNSRDIRGNRFPFSVHGRMNYLVDQCCSWWRGLELHRMITLQSPTVLLSLRFPFCAQFHTVFFSPLCEYYHLDIYYGQLRSGELTRSRTNESSTSYEGYSSVYFVPKVSLRLNSDLASFVNGHLFLR